MIVSIGSVFDSLVGSFVSIVVGIAGDPENFNFEIVIIEIMYIIFNTDTNIWRLIGVFDAVDGTALSESIYMMVSVRLD